MTKPVSAILEWATGQRLIQVALVAGVGAFALFRAGPYSQLQSTAGPLPEESVTSPAILYDFLHALGAGGRELYVAFQLWDFLNPLLIGLVSVVLVAWLLGRSRLVRGRTVALFVPLAGPAADVLENAVLLFAVAAFPAEARVGWLLPLVTTAKFLGIAATLILSIALSALAIARRGGPSTSAAT